MADKRLTSLAVARPPFPAVEAPVIPLPSSKIHPEQVIKDNLEPTVRVAENDESVE